MARQDLLFVTALLAASSLLSLAKAITPVPVIHPTLHDPSAFPSNIFITMRAGTDEVLSSNSAAAFEDSNARRTALYHALRAHARETQAPLLAALEMHSAMTAAEITCFWITNQIYVRAADATVLDHLRQRHDVSRVDPEARPLPGPAPVHRIIVPAAADTLPVPAALGYNLEIIHVPEVWQRAANGSGVIVASIDSGVRFTHEALRGSYKDDGYSWFDSLTGSRTPFDDNGKGTLSMGLIAGGLDVGVAPGAKWISCKGVRSDGNADQSTLLNCGQWILCPTHPDGEEPDCGQAPHVVANSWRNPYSDLTWFDGVIAAWHAAGIIPVWGSGEYGAFCSTLYAPRNVIVVGSTDADDRLSSFSSQGPPNSLDEPGTIKPDLTAPGERIYSTHHLSDDSYATNSGMTTFAAAHVTGVIALLLSVDTALAYAKVKQILESTSEKGVTPAGMECDGLRDSELPNFQFGHGRLDALAAYECVVNGYECLGDEEELPSTSTTESPSTPTTSIGPPTPTTTTTTTTDRPPHEDCSNGATRLIPDPFCCSSFYLCNAGQGVKYECPEGQHFDPRAFTCQDAGLVGCEIRYAWVPPPLY